jgi:archaellum biogenesis protein FlaJ (TadC family)
MRRIDIVSFAPTALFQRLPFILNFQFQAFSGNAVFRLMEQVNVVSHSLTQTFLFLAAHSTISGSDVEVFRMIQTEERLRVFAKQISRIVVLVLNWEI